MRAAVNLLRQQPHYRRDIFSAGLAACGFSVVNEIARPQPGDLLLIWNRYAGYGEMADHFERHGARVLVAENCPFGNGWREGVWYSIAGRHVAMTGGEIRDGGPRRWDAWGVDLKPFRTGGSETVILGQRGIGHRDTQSPPKWAEMVARRYGGRIRKHPGTAADVVPLDMDLIHAREVITWSSAAAVQALAMGVPVWHAHPRCVVAGAGRLLDEYPGEPKRDEAARLEVFRRLAWAIWSTDEIQSGEALKHALG